MTTTTTFQNGLPVSENAQPQTTIIASPSDILTMLATKPVVTEREPRADDKLVRCGNVYRSKFADVDKALVFNIDGLPTMFATTKGVIWMDIVSLQKDAEGNLTTTYRGQSMAFDTLHPSASGKSVIFRTLGYTYTMDKVFFDAMMSGKERNCMVKRSPIGQ